MSTISAFEAKTRFGELLDRVVEGEEIIITRHDKPVARLVAEGTPSLANLKRTGDALEALQKDIARTHPSKRAMSWKKFKSFVEEGRE